MIPKPMHSLLAAACAAAVLSAAPAAAADPASIDWSKIPVKNVKLFYPGQSGYDWLLTPAHKKGDKQVAAGKSCISCHEGDEADIGNKLVKGGPLEPTPIPGKKGVMDVAVQAAHDADYVYFRFQWKSQMNREGRMHDYIRYDGKGWKFWGGHRVKESVASGKEPPLYEDRFSIMLDDGKVPNFAQQGCWLTCHNGLRNMPGEPTKEVVESHPYLGKSGLKKDEVLKFLPSTRTDGKSWDKAKTADEIAKIKSEGGFLDLMQWRVHRSNIAGMSDDGYVLDYRLFDEGKGPFSWNMDRKTMTPKFMFDAKKVGLKALRQEDIGNPAKPAALLREANAAPYDPNAGWKEGDLLPGRLISRVDAKGSAADNDASNGTWKDGTYTLLFRRKLNTGHPADDKIMKVGGTYTIGLAVHDDNVTTRFHHVSFPMSLGLGVKADIQATTLK